MFFSFSYFAQKFLYANSIDPDQMPCLVASEPRLHCVHMSPKRISDHERSNQLSSHYTWEHSLKHVCLNWQTTTGVNGSVRIDYFKSITVLNFLILSGFKG